jgi:hypothetical protein
MAQTLALTDSLNSSQLIFKDAFYVKEQAPDQRALTIINAPGGSKT